MRPLYPISRYHYNKSIQHVYDIANITPGTNYPENTDNLASNKGEKDFRVLESGRENGN